MTNNYAFMPYDDQEPDSSIGLIYVPAGAEVWDIGPHLPGTGVLLYRADGSVLVTCPYGFVPSFNAEDLVCASLAAADLMVAPPVSA